MGLAGEMGAMGEMGAAGEPGVRYLVVDRFRASMLGLDDEPTWAFLSLDGSTGPYALTTTGGPLRIYVKCTVELEVDRAFANGAGFEIYPVIDGVRGEVCARAELPLPLDAPRETTSVVCDTIVGADAGDHTIGFDVRYYGNQVRLTPASASLLLIEELPASVVPPPAM
jgi:hypothetical protein